MPYVSEPKVLGKGNHVQGSSETESSSPGSSLPGTALNNQGVDRVHAFLETPSQCSPCVQTNPDGGRGQKVRSSFIAAASLAPKIKPAKDFYADDERAIEDLQFQDLAGSFPMLCYCDPDGDQKPCRFRPSGHKGRLPFHRKVLWAWPVFSWYALKYHKAGYMKKFYIDDYPNASLGIVAFSSVLSVLVDAFTDPEMAHWTDNSKSKYGRRRPFICMSAFFVPTVFVLSWVPLVPSGLAASVWFGVFHIMFKLADTLFLIPFDSWGAQFTPIYRERTSLWVVRDLAANLGILFGMALLPILFVDDQCSSTPETGCVQQPLIAAFFGLLHLHGALQLAYLGKEPSLAARTRNSQNTLGFAPDDELRLSKFTEDDTIPMLMSTLLNRPFRCLLLSAIAKAAGQEIPLHLLPFMTAWTIGEKCFSADFFFPLLVMCNLGVGLFAVGLWMWLASFFGKYRAYVCYTVTLGLTSLSFVFLGLDTGNCQMSYVAILLSSCWGAAYAGSFLLNDLVCDSVDYHEFLSGGKRREARYLMSVQFLPKFIGIPGECVPFLLLAYANYQRPLPKIHREPCGDALLNTTLFSSPDQFCAAHYAEETRNGNWCSEKATCGSYLDAGATFICNGAMECGFAQNSDVRTVLTICFSVVPAFFVLMSLVSLYYYPKQARTEEGHEKLMKAISQMRRGAKVLDPWQDVDVVLTPAGESGPNFGALSYFWPQELLMLLKATPADEEVDIVVLRRTPLISALIYLSIIPVGIAIIVMGIEDLSDDLGASVSPLGLMLVGMAIVGVWFHSFRVMAVNELTKCGVKRAEVQQFYNQMCPFIGRTPTVIL